jgi:myo-inositol-1(or 4)-monophosphatase
MEVAIAAARAAGMRIAQLFGQVGSVKQKFVDGRSNGLVTQADLEAENIILASIRGQFPSHTILSEESLSTGDVEARNLWVVDPLDGTNNFAHRIPHFSVSIAYFENGRNTCGVVHNPLTGDWFVAGAGEGAWFNGSRAVVSDHAHIADSIIGFGFYYDRGQMMQATLDAIGELFRSQIVGVRRFGSAALDLAYVGIGRFGGYFEYELSPWDFAAGKLFVEEAGGKVTNCQGQEIPIAKSSVLATNSRMHDELRMVVSRHWPH